jgi:hypothetical protein
MESPGTLYRKEAAPSLILPYVALLAIVSQNPFAIGLVLGEWYKFLYILGIASYVAYASWTNKRYGFKSIYWFWYFGFVLATIVCILINAAFVDQFNALPAFQYLVRVIQFFILAHILAIIGLSRILLYGYRLSVALGALALAFAALNILNQPNPFFDIVVLSIEEGTIYYSFPFGFTQHLLPAGDRLRISSYFTEAANFAYFQILGLIYAASRYQLNKNHKNRIAILIIFISILTTHSVAGLFTIILIAMFAFVRQALGEKKPTILLLSLAKALIMPMVLIVIIDLLGDAEDSILYYVWLSMSMRPLEWGLSVSEILTYPMGVGFGNYSTTVELMELDSVGNFSKEYYGPTNLLVPIFNLGLLYAIPYLLFFGAVFRWALFLPGRVTPEVKMLSTMVVAGLIFSGSYFQLNTAVFQLTMAGFFIILDRNSRAAM